MAAESSRQAGVVVMVAARGQGAPVSGHWTQAWRRFRRDRAAMVGGAIVVVLVIVALLAPWIAPWDYTQQVMTNRNTPPGGANILGTDSLGRDVLSRLMIGARISLSVGLISVGISATIGVAIGAVAGYAGGKTDLALMWVMDLVLAFPSLLLAITVASALGPSVTNAMIAIGIVGIPGFARQVRSSVLSIRGQEFVEAARTIGAGSPRIIALHIVPNVMAVVIVRATASLGFAILTEASLSFLGLGAQPPDPSWGGMLNEGRDAIRRASHLMTLPGLCIMMTVLAFNLLGDGLRDALDPRLKR
jgi:peptide/nickel transport system permease protein